MKRRGSFFLLLILLALAALVVLIFALGPGSRPETPPVVLATPSVSDGGTDTAPAADMGSRILTIDTGSVQNVIATLARASSYSRTLTAVTLWNGGSATTEIAAWVRGDNTRMAIRRTGSETVKNVLLRGEEKWIWYSDRSEIWAGPAAANDADAYQTLLTWEDILALDPAAILDAGYTEYGGELCVYARWADGALGYESLCYVSIATGLLMGVETYDGDALVYTMSSTTPDLTVPQE